MNETNSLRGLNRLPTSLLALLSALPLLPASGQTPPSQGAGYSVVDSGAFYRVWQGTVSVTNATSGQVSQQVSSYTELGDGMNYWSNGWTPAQDVIQATPTGAAAVQGQIAASFSGDITAPGAITLVTASGQIFQSHPIGLYYSDPVSGLAAQIGSVQPSSGVIYAPNVIVFTNVLSGLNADLVLVSARQGFEQNLVLKQAPPAPASFGLSNATSRLQFWTAMDACPQPLQQRPVHLRTGLVDNLLIFADCWFPVGSAFAFGQTPLPPPGQAAAVRQFDPADPNAVPTAKSLVTVAGQQLLIEEVNYTDLASAFGGLSQAALSPGGPRTVELAARGQLLPTSAVRNQDRRPIQVASGPYKASGVVLDYITLTGSSNSFTFTSGATYCISNGGFSICTGAATFQPGTCVKFATNAYLDLNCPVYTPSNSTLAVLTSVDDNAYGQAIAGSTGDPNYAAHPAIIMDYNDGYYRNLQNLLVRWAQRGIEWCEDPGYNASLSSSVFQNCQTALLVDMDSESDTLYLSNDIYCNVTTPVSLQEGTVSGSMAEDCSGASITTVLAWGPADLGGLLDLPGDLVTATAVAGGMAHGLALEGLSPAGVQGAVIAWGDNTYNQTSVPLGLSNVAAIAAGPYHSLACLSNGTVSAWGSWWPSASNHPAMTVPSTLTNIVAVAAGADHDVALGSNGTITVWGYTNEPWNSVPAGLTHVQAIAAGFQHTVAVSNGIVWAWGSGTLGNTNVPPGLSNVAQVAAGAFHTLALTTNRTVWAWGAGGPSGGLWGYGQSIVPAAATNVSAISAGGYHSMALRADGTLLLWGDITDVPPFLTLSNVAVLAAGQDANDFVICADALPPMIATQPANQYALSNQVVSIIAYAYQPVELSIFN